MDLIEMKIIRMGKKREINKLLRNISLSNREIDDFIFSFFYFFI
jgi:hypothetical protein